VVVVKNNDFDIAETLNIFWRHKQYVIAVFAVQFSLFIYLAMTLPDVYESSTLILITPQKLPSSYVNSTVTMTIQERIYSITQEILSRTSMEEIVKRFGLYPSAGGGSSVEGRVKKLRKNIQIENPRMSRGRVKNSFRLSFKSGSAKKAQQVAGALTSVFIEENLKMREQRAVGTTAFIKAEGDRLKKEVEEQEARVNIYKSKYQYELPEQLQANLSTLEQLGIELQSNLLRLSALEDRKANLEKQLVDEEKLGKQISSAQGVGKEDLLPREERVERMKTELDSLLSRYSDKHPDVIDLQREIQALEAEGLTEEAESGESDSRAIPRKRSAVFLMLSRQVADLNTEIRSVQSNNNVLKKRITSYQARIENTPLRSIELSKITRTYDITLSKYQDLLGKLLDSQLSENMEKKQKAEQFQMIDTANLPEEPVRPNRLLILLMGLVVSLGVGLGLAFLLENLNNSFKSGDDLSDYANIPLLASIPLITTRATVLHRRRQQALLVLGSVVSLATGLVAIRVYVQYFA